MEPFPDGALVHRRCARSPAPAGSLRSIVRRRALRVVRCSVTVLVVTACVAGDGARLGEERAGLPPAALLADNYERAAHVLEIVVEDVVVQEVYRTDRGAIGYLGYRLRGAVIRTLKVGGTVPARLDYRFTREYDEADRGVPRVGERYLIFLKEVPDEGGLWLLGEAAQFPMNPGLGELMAEITSRR
jgi:hypothetical protein